MGKPFRLDFGKTAGGEPVKKYIILLSGVNARVELDGAVHRCNFHTTRYIEAEDHLKARENARALIAGELEGTIRNKADDPLVLYVDWLKEVQSFDEYALPHDGGYVWYRE